MPQKQKQMLWRQLLTSLTGFRYIYLQRVVGKGETVGFLEGTLRLIQPTGWRFLERDGSADKPAVRKAPTCSGIFLGFFQEKGLKALVTRRSARRNGP